MSTGEVNSGYKHNFSEDESELVSGNINNSVMF